MCVAIFRLSEVGKLSTPKVKEKYEAGQFFLHRIFGYRGVILFPWHVKVYERNPYYPNFTDSIETNENRPIDAATATTTATANTTTPSNTTQNISTDPPDHTAQSSTSQNADASDTDSLRRDDKNEVRVDLQTYYQVLIDARDCPHVVSDLYIILLPHIEC